MELMLVYIVSEKSKFIFKFKFKTETFLNLPNLKNKRPLIIQREYKNNTNFISIYNNIKVLKFLF